MSPRGTPPLSLPAPQSSRPCLRGPALQGSQSRCLGSALLGRSQLACKDQTLAQQQRWAGAGDRKARSSCGLMVRPRTRGHRGRRADADLCPGPAPRADHRARRDPRAGSSKVLGSQSPSVNTGCVSRKDSDAGLRGQADCTGQSGPGALALPGLPVAGSRPQPLGVPRPGTAVSPFPGSRGPA